LKKFVQAIVEMISNSSKVSLCLSKQGVWLDYGELEVWGKKPLMDTMSGEIKLLGIG